MGHVQIGPLQLSSTNHLHGVCDVVNTSAALRFIQQHVSGKMAKTDDCLQHFDCVLIDSSSVRHTSCKHLTKRRMQCSF